MYFEQNVHCTLLKMDALYTKNTFKDYAKENERGCARWYFDFLFFREKFIRRKMPFGWVDGGG
ncbi:hypothetical protein [Simonsiella muelleri]|uniref:hypothetical protein n=1 Tax=Simonsiella muelleri TaxID=72 RepID=UPI0023F54119|nr:hypothetical protein [Simonsiella muelleri]